MSAQFYATADAWESYPITNIFTSTGVTMNRHQAGRGRPHLVAGEELLATSRTSSSRRAPCLCRKTTLSRGHTRDTAPACCLTSLLPNQSRACVAVLLRHRRRTNLCRHVAFSCYMPPHPYAWVACIAHTRKEGASKRRRPTPRTRERITAGAGACHDHSSRRAVHRQVGGRRGSSRKEVVSAVSSQ